MQDTNAQHLCVKRVVHPLCVSVLLVMISGVKFWAENIHVRVAFANQEYDFRPKLNDTKFFKKDNKKTGFVF
jgi:hypothetical protein